MSGDETADEWDMRDHVAEPMRVFGINEVLRNFECLIAQAAGGNPFAIAVDGSTSIQIVPVEKRETGEHDEWDVQV